MIDFEQPFGSAVQDAFDIRLAQSLNAEQVCDRIPVGHPKIMVRAKHQLGNAHFLDEVCQVLRAVDQSIEIEVPNIFAGLLFFQAPAATIPAVVPMIEPADIGRQVSAAMGRHDFYTRKTVQGKCCSVPILSTSKSVPI